MKTAVKTLIVVGAIVNVTNFDADGPLWLGNYAKAPVPEPAIEIQFISAKAIIAKETEVIANNVLLIKYYYYLLIYLDLVNYDSHPLSQEM